MTKPAVLPAASVTSSLPPDILPLAIKMQTLIDKLGQHALQTYYHLGMVVIELLECHRNQVARDPGVMEQLAEFLDVNSRTLYESRRFAQLVSKDVFKRVAKAPVSWTHIRLILGAGQIGRIEHWASEITQRNLTTDALQHELRLVEPPKRPAARRPAVPKSLREGMTKYEKQSSKFLQQLDAVFFSPDFNLADVVLSAPPDELTEELLTEYVDLIERQDEIVHQLDGNSRQMRRAAQRIEEVIELRKKQHEHDPAA